MTTDTDLETRFVDPAATEWVAIVRDHPNATVFHQPGWLKAIEATFGYEPRHRLLSDRTGDPVAAVPGFAVPDGLGRSVLNPFCEYGFPLVTDAGSDRQVLSSIRANVETRGAVVIKDVQWSDVRGYHETGYGGVRTGTSPRLMLDRSFERLRETVFDRRIRQRVRTARERDVQVGNGTLDTFYSLYVETMGRLGSPQFPLEFFEALDTHLEDGVTVLVARVEGGPIGALLTFERNETVHVWANGSSEAALDYRPNHLLYTSLIERACAAGYSTIDFGRSRRGSGVYEFKSQFGVIPYPLISLVAPPHRWSRASLEGYGRLAPITRRLAPIVTHPAVGPRLKRLLHE